jgi:hypothetical protein
MQRPLFLLVLAVLLGLAACSKGGANNGSNGPPATATQLNWDQGNWNQQNWQ